MEGNLPMRTTAIAGFVLSLALTCQLGEAHAKGPYPIDIITFRAVAVAPGAWCSALRADGSGSYGACTDVCPAGRIATRSYAPGRGLWCPADAVPGSDDEIAGLRMVENDG